MTQQPENLKEKALLELEGIKEADELESWRVRYLGRKGELTGILRSLAGLPPEERKALGANANQAKTLLEDGFKQKEMALRAGQSASKGEDYIDVTLPGRPVPGGHLHPITQTINEITDIFSSLGFQVAEGPEVEWDYYNFEALNIPAEHPARDSQSTFWVDRPPHSKKGPMLLRTQNTATTARMLEVNDPPMRLVEPGKVYRYEATDATHGWMFYHIDGIAVDKGITLADLKGTLHEFARRFFGEDRQVRFRCDFFPFVEPGVEIAIDCALCRGAGCRLCGQSGWIELGGAGMTHPDVLRRGGIDPEVYTSFAFGMGVDRMPMLRYGIDDIRQFYNNDVRFLRQF
ncbi:MAG: phenylalanine--tRNA ligase subunit alpha [Dehalococcoidales bacterium]